MDMPQGRLQDEQHLQGLSEGPLSAGAPLAYGHPFSSVSRSSALHGGEPTSTAGPGPSSGGAPWEPMNQTVPPRAR